MDDVLVSSRISRAKKEAGVDALGAMGATTSDLINSAFDYVIDTRRLPSAQSKAQSKKRSRNALQKFIAQSTLAVDWGEGDHSDKDVLRERKRADYESLA